MYRHGDVLLERVTEMALVQGIRETGVVAYGEATGHAHRVVDGAVLEHPDGLSVRAQEGTYITHEEHGVIVLPAGLWRVTLQREYDPYEQAARQVVD